MAFDPNNLRICGGQKSYMSKKQLFTSYYYWLNNIEGLLLANLKIYKLISFMGPFFRKWKEKKLRNNFSSAKSYKWKKNKYDDTNYQVNDNVQGLISKIP